MSEHSFGIIFFICIGIALIYFFVWTTRVARKERIEDETDILAMSNEELITDYRRTIFQLNQLPKVLIHGDIHKHSRLMRNLVLIEQELTKRNLK